MSRENKWDRKISENVIENPVEHEKYIKTFLKYDLNISHSKRLINFKIGKGFYLRIQPNDIDFRHDLTYKITPKFQIESGLNNNIGRTVVQTFFPRPPEEGDPNFDFRLSEKVKSNQRNKGYEVEGYLQGRFQLSDFSPQPLECDLITHVI